jgi:hypothetical protein
VYIRKEIPSATRAWVVRVRPFNSLVNFLLSVILIKFFALAIARHCSLFILVIRPTSRWLKYPARA